MDIFFFTCAVPLIVLNLMAYKTVKEFANLYNKKIDPKQIFSPEQANSKYEKQPLRIIVDSPMIIFTMYKIVFFTKYSDPELKKKAHIIRMYFFAMCLVLALNFIISLKMIYD